VGRLFWKFFVCILLAQLAATVGIGGAVWLKNRNQQAEQTDIDTSPPAEMAINSAAATLEFGGANALKRMLENMDRRRVYAVNDAGRELLGRIVSDAMLRESRALLRDEERRRVVRHVYDPQGNRYLLFLPSSERMRGYDKERSLLGINDRDVRMFMNREGMPGGQPPPRWEQPGQPNRTGQGGPGGQMNPGGVPSAELRGPPGGDMRGPMGPRFQPLTPWVPLMAAVLASLLLDL